MSSSYTSSGGQAGGSYASYQPTPAFKTPSSPYATPPIPNPTPPPRPLLEPVTPPNQGAAGLARDGTTRTVETQSSIQSPRLTERTPSGSKSRGDVKSRNGGASHISRGISLPLSKPRQLGSGLVPSIHSAWFLLVVVLESMAIIALVAAVFGIVEVRTETLTQDAKTVPVFLALLIFGFLFFIVMALDAFRQHNTIQVYGCLILNIALLITAALQITQVRDAFVNQDQSGIGIPCENRPNRRCNAVRTLYPDVKPLLIAVPVIMGIAQIPLSYLTFKLSQDFGWEIYRKIGADLKKRRMMLVYQIFVCFLKYTGFFGLAFCIAYLILVSSRDDAEFVLTIVAIPAATIVLFLSAIAVQKEIKTLMCFCIFCFLAGLAYFVFKITRIFEPSTEAQYRTVRRSLTFFSVFSILSLLATSTLAVICATNFGKGLKEAHETMGGILGAFDRKAAMRRKAEAQPVEIEVGEKDPHARLAGLDEEDLSGAGGADESTYSAHTSGRGGMMNGHHQHHHHHPSHYPTSPESPQSPNFPGGDSTGSYFASAPSIQHPSPGYGNGNGNGNGNGGQRRNYYYAPSALSTNTSMTGTTTTTTSAGQALPVGNSSSSNRAGAGAGVGVGSRGPLPTLPHPTLKGSTTPQRRISLD